MQKQTRLFALVDCNNFYASCERVFAPHLTNKPIVVLSNNDGCIIARSAEAKKLGIAMGTPYHMAEKFLRQNRVHVFSSNYALYGDMSQRVMRVLGDHAPRIEIYSIDEAFLDFEGLRFSDSDSFARRLVKTVYQQTGIPVSIGIAPTKTLAKAANRIAKKHSCPGSTFDLSSPSIRTESLNQLDISDVWGVGRRWSARLYRAGIKTAGQLSRCDPKWIRRQFNVVAERIVTELNGVPCLELEDISEPRKQIVCSRSFSTRISDWKNIRSAITHHLCRAGEKLRSQNSCALGLQVYLRTSPFDERSPYYANAATVALNTPTQDNTILVQAGLTALKQIFRPGLPYQKAGVMLFDLTPQSLQQGSLFSPFDTERSQHREHLMQTIDRINLIHGRSTIRYAAEGYNREWQMRNQFKSPCYTTQWNQIPQVIAG